MSSDLTPELARHRDQIRKYAEDYGLDFFETVFEMVDYEQINSLAALGGFPVRYPHWRFGMEYDQLSKGYAWGLQKIYEMVINTDPSYAYLMKSNSVADQKIVMAHVYGHVDFFKNNYWFSKTNRKMLDAMANHAVRIRAHMDRYGQDTVESFIDKCLSIEGLIDPFQSYVGVKRPTEEREVDREPGKIKTDRQYMDKFINPPEFLEEQRNRMREEAKKAKRNPATPMKDVLAFLLENAPLADWEHDVLGMIRDEAYYFSPQGQTKIMNEGWASYWHSKIMTQKALKDSEIVDFADHHAGVMAMAPGQINPYKIGLELFRDIEDRWNRGKFGKDYDDCDDMVLKARWDKKLDLGRSKIFEVRRVCNDITFIDEYLTEEFVERLKMYTYAFNRRTNQYEIVDRDWTKVREKLLFQLTNRGQPFIYVTDGNFQNKGELLLSHKHQGLDLDVRWSRETMTSLAAIWGRPVNVETEYDGQKKLLTYADGEFTEKFL
ncbi:MAG: SpoVR family protein [Bdellovibrionales bacterium GWB1_52_6]|nr:MAG: SpoVR family protein [Bdellovibrionales bacterium GWB1_52_6]OFZ03287.1 MAG: SpoVR family protein [Bdellovibrionales bacterium GWA1_52_35]HCM40569.1 SpoVR family protein [Bdellovibrionales bacterium]